MRVVALVITNDSDLATPINMVVNDLELPVGVAMPLINPSAPGAPRQPSAKLEEAASFVRYISDTTRWHRRLAAAQLAPTLTDGAGTFSKPPKWDVPPY